MFHNRKRAGPYKILAVAILGFGIGGLLGYLFMGTVHAVGRAALPSCPSADAPCRLEARIPCCLQMMSMRAESYDIEDVEGMSSRQANSCHFNDGQYCRW